MTFVSYAQNYEDIILRRALKDVEKGFYIDVGANDPVIDSVTKAFYDTGWRGINIEPVKDWFERLQQERPGDINLQLAAGDHKGELDFYEVIGTGLSTSDKSIAERHIHERGYKIKNYKVPVTKLSTICEQHPTPDIHFLKIDVEGDEKSVLQGLDLRKTRPWIVLVESTLPNLPTEDYENWEPILLAAEYEFVYFDGLNRFYVASEHKKIKENLAIPPNVFDNFVLSGNSNSSLHGQIAQIQSSLAEARVQQQELEIASKETNQQRKQLETQVTTLLANATQQDDLLHDKETKLQELLLSLTEKETQLQEVATTLTGNRRQIEKLEAQVATVQAESAHRVEQLHDKETKLQELLLSLTEKETQLQEVATALADNTRQIDKLKSQVETVQTESAHRNEQLRDKETKLQELLLLLTEKETQLQEVSTTLVDNKRQIDKLKSQVETIQAESTHRDEQLRDKETKLQEMLKTTRRDKDAANRVKEQLKQTIQNLEQNIESVKSENTDLVRSLQKKDDWINWLNYEWTTAKNQNIELQKINHGLLLESENITNELQAVYGSKSWRITWPLRKLLQFFSWLFSLPVRFILWLIHLPMRITRWMLRQAMDYVLNRPKLTSKFIARLARFPRVNKKLVSFASNEGLITSSHAPVARQNKGVNENVVDNELIQGYEDDSRIDNLNFNQNLPQAIKPEGKNHDEKSPLEKWFY